MNFAGRSQKRLHERCLDSTATVRSQYLIPRMRMNQCQVETRIQRATGLATEELSTKHESMHGNDSLHNDTESFQEAEASGSSSSRGIYKQTSTSSSASSTPRGTSFSYAPAESDQIRESWDSLMRWSKVRMCSFALILSIST